MLASGLQTLNFKGTKIQNIILFSTNNFPMCICMACQNDIKVEPYSIHGSFLKLEYLKTEFNEDSGTYAIVKVTPHSYRIMVNLSINDYFEVMRHP